MSAIASVELIVGLEIHVELSTRTKMFSRVKNVAHPEQFDAAPNTLIDPVTLGLPGALPVMNLEAVERSMMVGLALGCSIATSCRWDRKSYFYPDLPKNYQISQYQLPLCFDGSLELPPITADGRVDLEALAQVGLSQELPGRRIGIIRAHLEEDAGKLLHEAPGGLAIDGSIADYNRAGTPLLEIVTQPDFRAADEVVVFCRVVWNICRFIGATEGILQRGHMRFEPNINCRLTLQDGRVVKTPIVEIKNLNSFKAVKGAIEYELREQPKRWLNDGRELSSGSKSTRGWDDNRSETFLQREKEEAHDYRYFPDPDLVSVVVDDAWRERLKASLPELPLARARRYMRDFGLAAKEAAALTEERAVSDLCDAAAQIAATLGVEPGKAGRLVASMLLQSGAKRANERTTQERQVLISHLGINAAQVGGIVALRDSGKISSNAADELFGLLCTDADNQRAVPAGADPAQIAFGRGMIIVRDDKAMDAWCDQVIAANPKVAEDVRAGKLQAAGRLVGELVKLAAASGAAADAKSVREALLKKLGQG